MTRVDIVAVRHAAGSPRTVKRELEWKACVNVRDLGGLASGCGTTPFGRIVRSDTVRGLTSDGWGQLVGHGVRTIVDLRSGGEVAADRRLDEGADWLVAETERDQPRAPSALRRKGLANPRRVATVHTPLLGTWDDRLERQFDLIAAAEQHPTSSIRAVYLAMLELFSANVVAAIEAVAAAPGGGVLVHCQAGKDRTGIVVALALLLAGVDVEAIADDYALSGPNIAPLHDIWVNDAPEGAERERRRRIGLAPREAMIEVIVELEARWGGAEAYLTAAGCSAGSLEALRRRLAD